MKIFLACLQSKKSHNAPAYQFWEPYFKNGIAEAGHQWKEAADVDWAEGLVTSSPEAARAWRTTSWEGTVRAVEALQKTEGLDLFLGYFTPAQVDTAAVTHIRSLGIPCVNFFCDNVRLFKTVPDEYGCFDLHWVPERKALALYKAADQNVVYAPMPVWIAPEYRVSKHPERFGVSFIGSYDIQRQRLFAEALALGVPLEIRGTRWGDAGYSPASSPFAIRLSRQLDFVRRHGVVAWTRKLAQTLNRPAQSELILAAVRPRPDAAEYIKIIQESMICLGVNRYPSFEFPLHKPNSYSRLRDLEAPLMGACYLTEWTEGIEDLFEPGKEIEVYRNVEELADVVSRLQRDSNQRIELRRRAQMRALSCHTVGQSLEKIRLALGI